MPVLPLVASMTVWPGFSAPRALGALDDGERQAVLDRAHRVEGLDLDVDVDAGRRELVEPDERGVADGVEDVVVAGHDYLAIALRREDPRRVFDVRNLRTEIVQELRRGVRKAGDIAVWTGDEHRAFEPAQEHARHFPCAAPLVEETGAPALIDDAGEPGLVQIEEPADFRLHALGGDPNSAASIPQRHRRRSRSTFS